MRLDLSSLVVSRPLILKDDPLIFGLNMLAGKSRSSPYRVIVVDEKGKVQGVLTGRRVLEVLIGYRGSSLIEKKGVHKVLREPVHLFIDEARHIFTLLTSPQAILQYMAENKIGYVIVVDEQETVKGVVDENAILNMLKGRRFGVKVEEVMTKKVHTIKPKTPLFEAAKKMIEHRVRRLPVIEHETVKGLITITDILNHIISREKHVELTRLDVKPRIEDVLEGPVENVMSKNVISTKPNVDLGTVIDEMLKHDISGMPITAHEEKLVGVVSRVDIIASLTKLLGAQHLIELMS